MKQIFLVMLLAATSFAAIPAGDVYKLNNYMGQAAKDANLGTVVNEGGERGLARDGHQPKQILVGTYDYSVLGGQSLSVIELGVSLPDNAIITRSYIDVITALVGAGSTIALYTEAANDVKTATAVASWGIGFLEGQSTGTAASFKKMTAERGLRMEISGNALTAGKFKAYVEYVMSE